MTQSVLTRVFWAFLLIVGGCDTSNIGDSDDDGGGGEPGTGTAYVIPPFEIVRHGLMLKDVWSNGEAAICVGERSAVFIISDDGTFLLPTPDDFTFLFNTVGATGDGLVYVGGPKNVDFNPDSPAIFRFTDGLRITETIDSDNSGSKQNLVCATSSHICLTDGRWLWQHFGESWEMIHEFELDCQDVFPISSSEFYVANVDGLFHSESQVWEMIYEASTGLGIPAVEGLGAEQVLAIDDDAILRQDGGSGFEPAYHAGVDLADVNWASEDWAVAVGLEGTVVMYDGITWSRLQVDFSGKFTAVTAWKEGEESGALAVGHDGAIYRYEDGSWTGSHLEPGRWVDIAGDDQGQLFGIYLTDEEDHFFMQYDGASWEEDLISLDLELNHLFCLNAGAFWAVGLNGMDHFVAHYDGSDWSTSWLTSMDTPRDLWVAPDQTVFVACDYGMVYVGGAPESPIMPPQDFRGIWGPDATDVFVVGENGTICRRQEGLWTPLTSGTDVHLNAVHGGSSSHVVAAGQGGTVRVFDGDTWTPRDLGQDVDLDMVWSISPESIFVAAEADNVVAHHNGDEWEIFSTSWLGNWDKSVWTNGLDLWVAGGSVLMRYKEPPSFGGLLGTP